MFNVDASFFLIHKKACVEMFGKLMDFITLCSPIHNNEIVKEVEWPN